MAELFEYYSNLNGENLSSNPLVFTIVFLRSHIPQDRLPFLKSKALVVLKTL